MFGGLDPATVFHACRKVQAFKESDAGFMEDFSNLLHILSN
jgi:chromosomal replication initiator protein